MTSLPDFIRRPGDIVGAPPYRAEGCLMQAMLLKGNRAKQQAHIDTMLNRPADGAYTFHVLSDWVLLSALHVKTMRSRDAVDGQKGVMAEADIGFWTALRGGPTDYQNQWKLYWFPSFLYVDTPSAMASGREIYGYPKTAADIARGSDSPADPSVTVTTLHMPEYGPEKRPVEACMLKISAPTKPAQDDGVKDEVRWLWETVSEMEVPDEIATPPSWATMAQIMLRQTRDPFVLGRASLQEGLVAEPRALKVDGIGVLQGGSKVRITPSASHPVMETLGVEAESAVRGLWLRQDFEVGAARRLWRNP